MPTNDIYEVDLTTLANGIYMHNTFHFQPHGNLATAFTVFDDFKSTIMNLLRLPFSSYVRFHRIHVRLVNQPILDEYGEIIEDTFGLFNATPADPRLGIWLETRSRHTNSPYGSGGLCFGAPPYSFVQFPPNVHEVGIDKWQEWRDNMMSFYTGSSTIHEMTWGIFSRARHKTYPDEPAKYWFPITSCKIKPTLVTRRTRRPRGA